MSRLTRVDDDLRRFPEFRDLVKVMGPGVDPDYVGAGGAVSSRQNVALAQDGGAAKLDICKRRCEGP